jgi:hypothetical protein
MQGQPIRPIALWEVEPGTTSPTAFRRFLRHYHELENPQSQLAIHVGPTDRVTVVLDGTQRLTALNTRSMAPMRRGVTFDAGADLTPTRSSGCT